MHGMLLLLLKRAVPKWYGHQHPSNELTRAAFMKCMKSVAQGKTCCPMVERATLHVPAGFWLGFFASAVNGSFVNRRKTAESFLRTIKLVRDMVLRAVFLV